MKDSKKYYRDIKRLFIVYSKKERAYLKDLKEQIEEYDNPTYKELEEVFGTPIEVVTSYHETIDSPYLIKKLNSKRIIAIVCVVLFLLTTAVSSYETYVNYKAHERFDEVFPSDGCTNVSENRMICK